MRETYLLKCAADLDHYSCALGERLGKDRDMGRYRWGEEKWAKGGSLTRWRGRALPTGAMCSTVLPEEVVTSHCESSYQHDILLEVHLPVSVFIQFLHYLVHSICILLDLWKEKMEIYTTKLEPAQWLRGRNEQVRLLCMGVFCSTTDWCAPLACRN